MGEIGTKPDVAVHDIRMPNIMGVDAACRIKANIPDVRVLILTAYIDGPYFLRCFKSVQMVMYSKLRILMNEFVRCGMSMMGKRH